METYITVSFWLGIASLFIRVITMGIRVWPHTEETSIGAYVAATIVSLAFTIWAGIILFAS